MAMPPAYMPTDNAAVPVTATKIEVQSRLSHNASLRFEPALCMADPFDVFISHASGDTELALALKASIEADFTSVSVFVSSDSRSITPGGWFEKVKQSLASAKVVIVLCSPESVNHPWIAFEAGAAWVNEDTKDLILLCHSGMEREDLPAPFNNLQTAYVDPHGIGWTYERITYRSQQRRPPSSERLEAAARRLDQAVQNGIQQRQLRDQVDSIMALSYRDTPERREFLLVSTNSGGKWTFPKGTVARGTDRAKLLAGVHGELRKEAGATGELFDSYFGPFSYVKDSGELRKVLGFPVRVEATGSSPEGRTVRWCGTEEARALLTQRRKPEVARGLTDALEFVAGFREPA